MRYLYTILFLLLSISVYAQNISVSDFHLDEMDLTANQQGTIVLDQNGEKCALIKVKTTQTGFSFDAGSLGVSKTIQKTAEIWVYVPHGVRKLNISHQKYGQLDYQLPVTTQKAKTYIMDLKAETPLPVNSQRLTIKCQPKNAVVMIDGEMVETPNGLGELTLKLGSHQYVAMSSGYIQTEGTVELKAERAGKLTIELDPKEGTVTDTSKNNTAQSVETSNSIFSNLVFTLKKENVDIILGVTKISDLPAKMKFKEYKGQKTYTTYTKSGLLLLATAKDSEIISYVAFSEKSDVQLPAILVQNGFSWDLNIEQWAELLRKLGLTDDLTFENNLLPSTGKKPITFVDKQTRCAVVVTKVPMFDTFLFFNKEQ